MKFSILIIAASALKLEQKESFHSGAGLRAQVTNDDCDVQNWGEVAD